MFGPAPPIEQLRLAIVFDNDDDLKPIGMRMRAAYYLKQAYIDSKEDGDDQAAKKRQEVLDVLSAGLRDRRHGSLMRHEFAYVLGQMEDENACELLEEILLDDSDTVIVRHEAAEALGAIGAERSRRVLEEIVAGSASEMRPVELVDTCRLAINVMDWRRLNDANAPLPAACACMLPAFSSVDPAPPHPDHAKKSISELGDILSDASLALFDRYQAMFSLRNVAARARGKGGIEAVQSLGRALTCDDVSPLFRHEVAYVLGQLQHPASMDALEVALRRSHEHAMVRHEAAEALGAIEDLYGDDVDDQYKDTWPRICALLKEYSNDEDDVVAQSCVVALDAADYWGHANTSPSLGEESDRNREESTNDDSNIASTFGQHKAQLTGLVPTSSSCGAESGVESSSSRRQVLAGHFNVSS